MNDWERRVNEMALRALAFLLASVADFTDIVIVDETITILQTETARVAALGTEKVTKTVDSKDKTIFRGDARDALRKAMEAIAAFWRPMAKHHGNAYNKFQFISGSDQLLIDDAGRFIAEAEPLKEAFTGRGMDGNFIIDLTAKRNAFIAAIQDSESAKGERIGTNAGFAEPLRRCRIAVEEVDPTVKFIYRDNPSKLAEWLFASRVEKR